jgi:type IX secretion system PorP/SprF family membrane protein
MMKSFFSLCFMLLTLTVKAQDPQLSQFFSSAIYQNPAFTGQTGEWRGTSLLRWQWPGIANINTQLVGVDGLVAEGKVGLGLMAVRHTQHLWFEQKDISALFSYKMYGDNLSISMGLQPGVKWNHYGALNGTWVDQFSALNNGASMNASSDPFANSTLKEHFFTIGTGILFDYNRNYNNDVPTLTRWWGGITARHESYSLGERLPFHANLGQRIFWSVHGGVQLYRKQNSNYPKAMLQQSAFSLMFNLRNQYKISQLDLYAQYSSSPIVASIGYRGIPLRKVSSHLQQDAIIFSVGCRVHRVQIQGTYDLTISGLKGGGSYELGFIYGFSGPLFNLGLGGVLNKRKNRCPDEKFTIPMF